MTLLGFKILLFLENLTFLILEGQSIKAFNGEPLTSLYQIKTGSLTIIIFDNYTCIIFLRNRKNDGIPIYNYIHYIIIVIVR